MELVFLALILVLFLLPSILIGRKQRQRQREVLSFQQSLTPGQRVVTAGGIVGIVTSTNDSNSVDLEIAPNVVVTFDRMGVLRSADAIAGAPGTPVAGAQQTPFEANTQSDSVEDRSVHPENQHPETGGDSYGPGNYGDGDYGQAPDQKN